MEDTARSEIDHLYRIEKFMASMTDLDALLAVIIREAALATESDSCSLALYEETSNDLCFFIARGEKEQRSFERQLQHVRMPMGHGIVGWCAENREPVNIKDARSDPRFDTETDKKTGFATRSILAVPMVRREKLVGVVEAVNKRDGNGFSEHDQQVLTVLATQAALVIENARLVEENVQQARLAALGQGIGGAAHCIKNILNGMTGGEYILQLGLKRSDMEKIVQGWNILSRNSTMMKDLVMDMLTFSRPRPPEYEDTDVNQLCTDIAELVRGKASERNAEVELELDPDMGKVVVDPKGLYRCLLNLAGNAVEACPEQEGAVTISSRMQGDEERFLIVVADNGCGISEEDRKQLFKAFFSTKGSKGTGLGLAVTHKIISEHGGDIGVESEVGAGTSFTIRLPLKPAKQPENEA